MWNGRRIIFCTCFASGSVEPFPCINGAKHVLRGNTNPFGCAEIQLCANMSFAPHIEPSNLLVWNYNLHLQKNKATDVHVWKKVAAQVAIDLAIRGIA